VGRKQNNLRAAGLLTAVLVGLAACADGAVAVRSGGHNPPTRKLEAAFKVAGGLRAASEDGCYPPPRRLAALIRTWAHPEADVAADFDSVHRRNVVYVIRRGTFCGRVRLALRARGRLFILDTAGGEVYVQGQRNRQGTESQRAGRGPLRALALVTQGYRFAKPNRAKRLLVACPKGSFPLGGGMTSTPPLSTDGEGVYPQSYERLGVQRGYHITALVIDPSPADTTPRWTTIQVVCGRGLVPTSSPHKTVFVRRHQTNTAIARCPRGQYLFSGGFQRTNFTTPFLTFGGNYITESRAISPQAWQVTATAAGHDGGELTAIAHCVRNKRPLMTEVSASTPLAAGRSATPTTPPCPPGLELAAGGFSFGGLQQAFFAGGVSFGGSQQAFFAGGHLDPDGTWSATGFGYFGGAPSLTVYGYCLRVRGEAASVPPAS
jgi:hypothetical protein